MASIRHAAFVIPTATHKQEQYIYLGIEANGKSRGLASGFGGKREFKKGKSKAYEPITTCARRELQEESLGVFAKNKKKLTKKLKIIEKKTVVNTKGCANYFLPVEPNGSPMRRFAKQIQSKKLKKSQQEMDKIIAVKVKNVIKAVNSMKSHKPSKKKITFQGYTVRGITAKALVNAVRKKVLK